MRSDDRITSNAFTSRNVHRYIRACRLGVERLDAPSFSGTRRAQDPGTMLLALANGACRSRSRRESPVMTMRCRAVRDWFLSLGASSRWMGSLFRRLGNAVRHRDESIAPRRLESMPVCRTQHFAHRNEEEDITEGWSNSPERTQSVSISSQGRLYQQRYFGGRADVVFKDESTWPRSLFST